MTKIFLFMIFLILAPLKSYALWDLKFITTVNDDIEVTMELVSIPFEGVKNPNLLNYNRNPPIALNGSIHRRYQNPNPNPTFFERNILYHKFLLNLTPSSNSEKNFQSTYSESSFDSHGRYGYGKYLVTIKNLDYPERVFRLYLNTLDSDLGTQFPNMSSYYTSDCSLIYERINNVDRIRFHYTRHLPVFTQLDEYITLEEQGKELKYWELLANESEPLAIEFFARSTPFPVNKDDAEKTLRVFNISTNVVLDQVYRYDGNTDLYGYNTINVPYYDNLSTLVPFHTAGKTYLTPKTVFDPDPNLSGDEVIGVKIIIDDDSKMTLTNGVHFWVHGVSDQILDKGDTLILKQGGTLELLEGSELFTYNGGRYINEGGTEIWSNEACHRAFFNTEMIYTGSEHIINNGGFFVIDGDATLKLGDNTTMIFDGANSYLKLKPNSDVVLGNNSKIVFKNGAYLDADGTSFTSSGVWEGLYFEDAGTSTQASTIQNCTFTNAKVPIKIYNTSTSTANNNIIIQNCTLTVPNGGSYGIYADHINSILIKDNHFYETSSSPKPSIYIKHPYLGDGLPGGGASPSYSLNIISNTFSNTNAAMIFAGYTSSLVPYYIYGNTGSVQGSTFV